MEYVAAIVIGLFAGYGMSALGSDGIGYFNLFRKLDLLTAEISKNTKASNDTLDFFTEINGEK